MQFRWLLFVSFPSPVGITPATTPACNQIISNTPTLSVKIFTGKRVGCVVSVLCLVWTWLDLQAAANHCPTTGWRPRVSQEAHQAQEMPRNALHARAGQLVQGQLEDAPRKRRHLNRSFMFAWKFFYWNMVCEYLLFLQIPEHDIIYI
jgi:hypothetical protein